VQLLRRLAHAAGLNHRKQGVEITQAHVALHWIGVHRRLWKR
jgi:hypothetical protein